MKFTLAATALSLALAAPASAALAVGDQAPDFDTRAAQGVTIISVHLADLLKKGPVVLYFFPAAFTSGCTVESHEFAENVDKFKAAGATLIGMSADPVETLARFSSEECGGKFPIASAGPRIINGFDVDAGGVASRTTYVIASSGKIAYVHEDEDYREHVSNSLAFVQGMNK